MPRKGIKRPVSRKSGDSSRMKEQIYSVTCPNVKPKGSPSTLLCFFV